MNPATFLVPFLACTSTAFALELPNHGNPTKPAAFAEAWGVDAAGFSSGFTCGGEVTMAMTGAGPASAR